ncbi:cupredoxin domain-containing protein [Natrialbaceae archaeon AArc-T1-2]|uniref:cupredoxin domain-containing protein n=1 Tax=Natrialbaceae archaeon AArc-T1-2 TaxID=3053904 RepID=UPI00255B36B6|nr:plastocyanin/azurin family copper-binding protein [Natrialbaceae archaeon AArc-T1-2]WIV67839.1 plastocyanin/azurin family copper-binding protein [Natrialbaceae archaeon AArc-T1-2]
MDRRQVLLGSGAMVTSVLAGCTGNGDDEPATDDGVDDEGDAGSEDETGVVLESACDAGEAVIEAVAAGEHDEAIAYSPHQHFHEGGERYRDDLHRHYESVTHPDEVHAVVCENNASDERLLADAREMFDADVNDAAIVTYTVDLEVVGNRYDSSINVGTLELDGEWYAEFRQDLVPGPRAIVDVDGDRSRSVEITVSSLPRANGVYVRGDGIDDPSAYVLDEAGETLSITADEEGIGGYTVIAYIGDAPSDVRTGVDVETFRVVGETADEASWEDVYEIELEGLTGGWVGVSPGQIAGVENPTLRLVEGREYDLTWTNVDGGHHNVAMIDADEDVLEGYETEVVTDEGERQTLTFTATDEIVQYYCDSHQNLMRGDIEIMEV